MQLHYFQIALEWQFILFIVSLLAIVFFIQNMPNYPTEWKIINNWNYLILTGSIVAIASTCVIATGIPCTVAFLTTSAINIVTQILFSPIVWLTAIIFIPLTVTLLYILSRLARGGG